MSARVRVQDLVVRYGARLAVDGVSFAIEPGRTLGLVGESGSGKTTVARAVAGMLTPAAGEVLIGDRPAGAGDRAARRSVQMVFQDPRSSLNPRLTVRRALVEAARIAGGVPRAGAVARAAELLELVELRAVPLLRSVPGVVEVNTWGGERRTLDVVGQPEAMARWRLTLGELEAAVTAATGTAAGSSLADGPDQSLLRGVARPTTPWALGGALVRPALSGAPALRLADVAELRWGASPRIGAATASGAGETVYAMVQMLRGDNALQVMGRVHEKMAEVRAVLPEDVAVDIVYDRSKLVHATLATVAKNLVEGGLLVITVLFALLGSLRAGLLVALVIPLSMIFALAGMALLDIPGNLMSLGAIDFGLLVDGAVVMVEAVFCGAIGATTLGPERVATLTRQVARPVFFSVLVILLVYVPIVTLTGVDGKMFRPMAAAVIMALLGSLVLALTFVPAAAATLLRSRDIPAREPLLVRVAEHLYRPALRAATRAPAVVAIAALAALAGGAVLFSQVGAAFVPQLDEGDLVIQTERSPNISLESAAHEATALEQVLLAEIPEVRAAVSRIGSPAVATDIMGIEQADVFVELAPRSQWRPGLDRDALVAEIAAAIHRKRAPGLLFRVEHGLPGAEEEEEP